MTRVVTVAPAVEADGNTCASVATCMVVADAEVAPAYAVTDIAVLNPLMDAPPTCTSRSYVPERSTT